MSKYLRLLNKIQKIEEIETPSKLILYVTNKCNLHCKHCFLANSYLNTREDTLTYEEIKKILSSLRSRLTAISLAGGEVVLRKDLAELTLMVDQVAKPRKISVFSNGYFTDKIVNYVNMVAPKINSRLWIEISLDGLEKTHDNIRNTEGLYKKALLTIESLKKLKEKYSNVDLNVITTIHNLNINEVLELNQLIEKKYEVNHIPTIIRDIKTCAFNLPDDCIQEEWSPSNNNIEIPPLNQTRDIINKIYDSKVNMSLQEKMEQLSSLYALEILETKQAKLSCKAGIIDGVIYSNGDVAICENAKTFANVRDFDCDFYKLWISNEAQKSRSKMSKCYCTHQYNLINSMRYDEETLNYLEEWE